jgi:hypothetical protein
MANRAPDQDLYQAMDQRLLKLNAERLRWQANLAEYRAEGNEEGIGVSLATLAEVNRHEKELRELADDHIASINKANEREEMTDAEFLAMSPEKMAKHPEAVERIFSKSKYYSRDMWNDPVVQQRVREGQAKWADDHKEYRRRGQG